MKIEDDRMTMEDGTSYGANRGIIGLDEDGEIFDGYDGKPSNFDVSEDGELPKHHKIEIAEHMIAQWTKLLNSLKA